MADGFIVRKGGVTTEQALAPTITEISTTETSITFTIKNNDTASATIAFRVCSVTASGQTLTLAADTTSSNFTVSDLDDDTTFTVFATANITGKIKSEVAEKEITTDKGFEPSDLSPQLWLDAADASTITASSGSVSQWNNKGSLGNFTQGTSASQPTTGVSTLNGLNVVNFASDFMNATNQNEFKFLHDGTKNETFAVVKFGTIANPNNVHMLFGTNRGSGTATGVSIFYDDRSSVPRNDRIVAQVTNSLSPSPVSASTPDDYFVANTFNILSVYLDPSNATAADRLEFRINNGNLQAPNTDTGTPSTSNPSFNLQLGAAGDSTATLTGSIAEMIIITGSNVTSQNRTDVVNYLADKWGITI